VVIYIPAYYKVILGVELANIFRNIVYYGQSITKLLSDCITN